MGFSLPNFLRRTPPAALEHYFAACGFCGLEGVNWTSKDRALLGQVLEAVEALPDHDREHVFDDFERATLLCDEIGQRALQSVLADELRDAVRAGDSHEARALLVLLRDPSAFDHAPRQLTRIDFATDGVGADFCCPRASHRNPIKPD